MKALILFLLTVVALSFSACKKEIPPVDRCATVNCQNGGTCNSGVCDCPPNYTGVNCQILQVPICTGVNCLNDGYCINGTCSCPPGWSGDSCQVGVPFTRMVIDTIIVVDFPTSKNNGTAWDTVSTGDSLPDVYVTINEGPIITRTGRSTQMQWNCTNAQPLLFDSYFSVYRSSLFHTFSIGVWDSNLDVSLVFPSDDDLMGGISFIPNNVLAIPYNVLINNSTSFTLTSPELTILIKVSWTR